MDSLCHGLCNQMEDFTPPVRMSHETNLLEMLVPQAFLYHQHPPSEELRLLLIVDRFRFKSGAYASAKCVCLRLAAARTFELHIIAERNKPEPNEEALFKQTYDGLHSLGNFPLRRSELSWRTTNGQHCGGCSDGSSSSNE
jgi:hypothetical protein